MVTREMVAQYKGLVIAMFLEAGFSEVTVRSCEIPEFVYELAIYVGGKRGLPNSREDLRTEFEKTDMVTFSVETKELSPCFVANYSGKFILWFWPKEEDWTPLERNGLRRNQNQRPGDPVCLAMGSNELSMIRASVAAADRIPDRSKLC